MAHAPANGCTNVIDVTGCMLDFSAEAALGGEKRGGWRHGKAQSPIGHQY
jgi:hypothetical protein